MVTKTTKSFRHCTGEDYEISIFICRGRQKAHYPKCPKCEFRTTTEEISPIPVKKETVTPPLPIQTSSGSIMVKSEPLSAVIYLDDDNIGVTPAIITQLHPGKYKIKIKMSGYATWCQSVDVKPSKETSLTAVLQGKDCSVVIESNPSKAEIFIDGNNAGVTPVTIKNVKTGEYFFEVKLDGYETWSKEINVEAEKETYLNAELLTTYGSISLDSKPTKAKVFLDGNEVSTTPASLRQVTQGTHLVEVRKDGYRVWEKSVDVEPAKETVVTAILQANTGSVIIKSKPDNARIYLDGKHVGTTPESIPSINPGTHEIKVELDNYDVWNETVNFEAGKESVINAVLQRSTGSLMVESDPVNAMIFVDGKEIGQTPEIIMSSAKGTHAVEVRMEGYDIWKENVEIVPGTEKSLTAILQKKTGSLNINSQPSGGTVFLDGDETGTTPGNLKKLELGTHKVEVKLDGYVTWSDNVIINADKENKIEASLQILTGTVSIKSDPSNTLIIVDGNEVGNAPADIAGLTPGKHIVEVRTEGYENWSESVEIEHSKQVSLTVELQQLTGALDIKSEPTNALIIIDGNEVGNAPAVIADLKPGKHLVEARMKGYESWSESVEIEHSKQASLTVTLQQLTGSLNIKSEPTNAVITVDGNEVGNAPAVIADLKPGKHHVEVKMSGHENWSENVDIEHSKEAALTAVLQLSAGSVCIKSEPSVAVVLIDGKEIGTTPLIITDPSPGTHNVELKKDGYEIWSDNVEIEMGKEANLTAVLQLRSGAFNINSVPPDATILIDGKEVGTTPSVLTDISLGRHDVEVRMDGFEDWSESVVVESGKDVTLKAVLESRSGSFTINSKPSGAMILIDDKQIDTTPLTITDPNPGKHTVEVKMDGYETWSESVNIVPGEAIKLTAALQIKAGTVSIFSEPSDAVIFIDGKEVGTTPAIITDPSPGTHTIEVKMDGFKSWTESVDIESGKEFTITADLQMNAGSINVNSIPPEAMVHIDNKEVGKAPVTISDLNPGKHLVTIILDEYEPWSESVEIRGNKENRLNAELKKITGSINIESNPPEATIYLDGEKIGITPDSLKSVTIGMHEIELKREGHAEWIKTIKVKKGKELVLNAVLQPNTGTASIESEPTGAKVSLDGKDAGKTPVSLSCIKIGTHEVALRMDGYVSCKSTIKIKAGKVSTLTEKLLGMTGSVNINTKPLNAIIWIDGKKYGQTPANITDMSAGKYKMEVKMDGYVTWGDDINVEPGKDIAVTAELQMKPGTVSINSDPANAMILIDSKEAGTTPKIVTDLSFEVHHVEVKMDGYESWDESVNVEPGIELSVTAELQMKPGSVSINSEPSDAIILINNKKVGTTPGTLTDIKPGKHQIEVRKEGFETWIDSIDVRGEEENILNATLKNITGSINIKSSPSEVAIFLDGEEVGTTPDIIKSVSIGVHVIEVRKAGYTEWKKKINVKKGKEITLNAAIQSITGTASLESDPIGAMIFIDGEDVGKTPKVITGIDPGKHEVEIRLDGYDSCVKMMKIKAGREFVFAAALQRKRGSLVIISSPSNAMIYLEGKKSGKTPREITELLPGSYTIEVKLDKYQTWSENVDVAPGKEMILKPVLRAKPGSISIKSTPPDAMILIDGKEVGTTPETINDIESGAHVVELMVEGYEVWSEKIEVTADKELYLTSILQEMAGSINIKSEPSNAIILIDGKRTGTTPAVIKNLTPGEHIVNISMDGHNAWSESIEIEGEKEKEITAILQEIRGTVIINSIPDAALILIDGEKVGTTPRTISDIKPGMHMVEVSIDGYESWSENIEITDKEHTITARLQEKSGSIDIKSEPSNATILIDGKQIGATPETIKDLKPGIHQVEVRMDGCEDWSNSVEVIAEKVSTVTASLQNATGSISIKSTPLNAEIYIDGEETGTTPATLSFIPIGAHEIEVKLSGHENWKKSIIIKKEKEMSLTAALQLNIGSISIESYPENAKINLDGKEVGSAPIRLTDIIVGTHEVEVLLDGYVTWKKTIKVKAEKEISITADLKKNSDVIAIKTDDTIKIPEIEKPIIHETPELELKPEKVKEKIIDKQPEPVPSSDRVKSKYSPDKLIKLRSTYDKISGSQIESLPFITINEKNNNITFCYSSIKHHYEEKPIGDGDVVIDHATGLMWFQSGSSEYFNLKKANKWLKKANKSSYAGFDDWRFPTLEEAFSLLEDESKDNNQLESLLLKQGLLNSSVMIDPVFDNKQWGTWTGDKSDTGDSWIVTYVNGTISHVQAGTPATFIRPVRSLDI